ncbi:MAG: hypothetical protein V5A72_02200, partial [Candidatus Nanohaloarchaea archaeon]
LPKKAVTQDKQLVDKLEKRGIEIYHLEEVEGIELIDYIVLDKLPEKEDFESVIKEYQGKDDRNKRTE